MKPSSKAEYRTRRHLRTRQRIVGSQARPRMSVFVSSRHIYVQFIDDAAGVTVAAVSTVVKGGKSAAVANVEAAKKLGAAAAKAAQDKGVSSVVFDRGGFAYRGRVKVLADAAREAGLKF